MTHPNIAGNDADLHHVNIGATRIFTALTEGGAAKFARSRPGWGLGDVIRAANRSMRFWVVGQMLNNETWQFLTKDGGLVNVPFKGGVDFSFDDEIDGVLEQSKTIAERPPLTPDVYGQPLGAVTPNGVTTINFVWTPPVPCKCLIIGIEVAYRTLPASTLGTILLDVFRLRGGASQSILSAPVSLEADNLTAEVWKSISLTDILSGLSCSDGDYFFATITSNNADAVDGTGGGLVLSYGLC